MKVLIFDDDTDILELCEIVLEGHGYTVVTSETCENILDQVETVKPDVIFMDNWIPKSGGIIATRLLKSKEAYKKIPVIYFSANNDIKHLAEKAGADAWLAKPFNIKDLEKVIKEGIENSRSSTIL